MREGFDREVDSLLRRTARAPAGARGNGAGESSPDSHLDADELAAFAEGALPEAARMSAVSHLADCGECRALAVNLTRAAGVEAKLEKGAAAAAASPARESKPSRGRLAALFAPRTLRYVAPALALFLVAAVSFVALRSRREGGLARLEESNASPRAPVTAAQNSAQPSTEGLTNSNSSANANSADANSAPASQATDELSRDKSAPGATAAREAKKDAEAEAPDGSGAPARSDEKAADAAAQPVPPPSVKEEDEPAAAAGGAPAPVDVAKSAPVESPPASKAGEHMKAGPPPPAQSNDDFASNETQQAQKRAAQQRGVEPQSPDGAARNRSAANNATTGGALARGEDRDLRARRESPPSAKRGRSDQDAASEAERTNSVADSRAVAGHRFRRDGGAWVDANYKSSMSSTGVRRGTDAYRALVADIPEIGRVVEQLGGEVVVVVRGRAYRIR